MRKPSIATAIGVIGLVLTVTFGIPSWLTLFIEHPETLDAFQRLAWGFLRLGSPLIMLVCGVMVGWGFTKRRALKQLEAKDVKIEELKKRPTQEQMDKAVKELKSNLAGKTQAASDLESMCSSLQAELNGLKGNLTWKPTGGEPESERIEKENAELRARVSKLNTEVIRLKHAGEREPDKADISLLTPAQLAEAKKVYAAMVEADGVPYRLDGGLFFSATLKSLMGLKVVETLGSAALGTARIVLAPEWQKAIKELVDTEEDRR